MSTRKTSFMQPFFKKLHGTFPKLTAAPVLVAGVIVGIAISIAASTAFGQTPNGPRSALSRDLFVEGNVGIGTAPALGVKMDVNGPVKLLVYDNQPFACDAAHRGTLIVLPGGRPQYTIGGYDGYYGDSLILCGKPESSDVYQWVDIAYRPPVKIDYTE